MAPSTSRSPPRILASARGDKRVLYPALIAACSFLAGIIFSFAAHPSLLQPQNQSIPYDFPAAPIAVATDSQQHEDTENTENTENNMPLGLRWFKAGYENPWQFSVSRTGIDELNAAFDAIIKRDSKLPRVVVSFTSLPKRFTKYARSMLEIIKRQTYVPDRIYVAIPKTSRRSNETFQVPSWLQNDPLVTILRPKVDYGPATKLIPALQEEKRLGNTDTRIITVDDDNEGGWTDTIVMSMLAYSLVFEDAAIGRTAWNVTCMVKDAHCSPEDAGVPERQFQNKLYNFIKQADDYACHSLFDWLPSYFANCLGAVRKNHIAYADVIEGYRGALYQPRFFNLDQVSSIMNKKRTPEFFFVCDDVWFSGWLGMRGVKRVVMNAAIDKGSDIAKKLVEYSKQRELQESLKLLPETEEDKKLAAEAMRDGEVEKGLHAEGDFVKANHDAVRWFDEKGAWTKGMWDKPEGFLYPSEIRMERERKEDKAAGSGSKEDDELKDEEGRR